MTVCLLELCLPFAKVMTCTVTSVYKRYRTLLKELTFPSQFFVICVYYFCFTFASKECVRLFKNRKF